MIPNALRQAVVEDVLACPQCAGSLELDERLACVRCPTCARRYPLTDGIPVFLDRGSSLGQEDERQFRDAVAAPHLGGEADSLMGFVAQHHCVPMMRQRAWEFKAQFAPGEWLLDVGVGWGWHWTGGGRGARVIGLDMSLTGLRLARRLLRQHDDAVALVCADAASLPIRTRSIAGVWSVQAFQHFPREILVRVQAELDRVLRDRFRMAICCANPAWLYRAVYRLCGKRFHRRGKRGPMEVNHFSAEEWAALWQGFRGGAPRIRSGYSELFFHPEFHLRPRRYPVRLEQALVTRARPLAALVARQVDVRIEAEDGAREP